MEILTEADATFSKCGNASYACKSVKLPISHIPRLAFLPLIITTFENAVLATFRKNILSVANLEICDALSGSTQ
jgi:hypothetical protein